MCSPNSFSSHRCRATYSVIYIFLVLTLVATPLNAQSATPDATDRVSELHSIPPTVEDLLHRDEGRWSLKHGVINSVFFKADGLHVISRTSNKGDPSLMMTQSNLAADKLLVEVEARHVKGSLFNGFGFYLKHAPGDYIFFYISNNGYAAIQHTALNKENMLIPWQESTAIQTQNHATNKLALLIENGRATLIVNDSEVATVDGLVLEGATLGLMATSYEESLVEVVFSNLRYWNLDTISPPCATQNQPNEDIIEQLSAAAFTIDDLPDGFEVMSTFEMRRWIRDSFLDALGEDGSIEIVNRFGYFHPDMYNLVFVESGSIVTPIDGLITYMATFVNEEPNAELLEIDQIGDESRAFAITATDVDEPTRLEFLLFRRDELVVLLLVAFPEGTEPIVALEDLVDLWDDRLATLSEEKPRPADGLDCLNAGIALIEQGKWRQALDALTLSVELDPENAESYFYRGLAHYQLGIEDSVHFAMAIEDLTQAMESEEFFAQASTVLNSINQVADAELLLDTYSRQIENSENPAAAYARRGIVYRNQVSDLEMAIDDLTQAIRLAAKYQRGDYYVERAFTHMENGDAEAAIQDATQAIEHEYTADRCRAYAYRGGEYAKLGDYEQAEADLELAHTYCSDNAEDLSFVSHQLATVRYHQGDIEDTLSIFGESIEYRSAAAREAAWENWISHFASEQEKNFDAIITYFETLVIEHQLQEWREGRLDSEYKEYLPVLHAYDEVYAGTARTYSWLGSIYEEQSEYDLAIEAYTKAIDVDPADISLPYWYLRRGRIFYDLNDFDNARDDLTVVIALTRPDAWETATAHNLLGLMASEQGEHEVALANYNMAISLAPDNAVFYFNRALTFYDLDDYESTIADLEMVLELSEDGELRREVEDFLKELK